MAKRHMKRKNSQSSESTFNYADFERRALKGLQEGQNLVGDNGLLKELMSHLVQSSLEGEMEAFLTQSRREGQQNRRNGHTSKTMISEVGDFKIHPPRDRQGDFSPRLVEKWDRTLHSGFDSQVLELYSIGTSVEDIRQHILKMYGVKLSAGQISAITESVRADIEDWQRRPLKSFYVAVFLDAIHYRIRVNGVVETRAVYTVYGIDAQGNRDVLCLKIGQGAEGAKEWGRILDHIKDRGVEDVLFFCVDGLQGFPEAILEVYPNSTVQRCIVHMMRTSLRFVDDKDAKALVKDLKAIYQADDEAQGLESLDNFEQRWGKKYPEIGKSWRKNWSYLTAFFGFSWAVRKLIYTTNTIEGLHRMLRKTTKTKGAFVSEKALSKVLYLTLMKKEKVWKKKVHTWKTISRSLHREFGERFEKHVNF